METEGWVWGRSPQENEAHLGPNWGPYFTLNIFSVYDIIFTKTGIWAPLALPGLGLKSATASSTDGRTVNYQPGPHPIAPRGKIQGSGTLAVTVTLM